METRLITQIKLYFLKMNHMTSPKLEMNRVVAISADKDELIQWYKEQLSTSGTWNDDGYFKNFLKNSPLEWYNPLHNTDFSPCYLGHGIYEEWTEYNRDTIFNYCSTYRITLVGTLF